MEILVPNLSDLYLLLHRESGTNIHTTARMKIWNKWWNGTNKMKKREIGSVLCVRLDWTVASGKHGRWPYFSVAFDVWSVEGMNGGSKRRRFAVSMAARSALKLSPFGAFSSYPLCCVPPPNRIANKLAKHDLCQPTECQRVPIPQYFVRAEATIYTLLKWLQLIAGVADNPKPICHSAYLLTLDFRIRFIIFKLCRHMYRGKSHCAKNDDHCSDSVLRTPQQRNHSIPSTWEFWIFLLLLLPLLVCRKERTIAHACCAYAPGPTKHSGMSFHFLIFRVVIILELNRKLPCDFRMVRHWHRRTYIDVDVISYSRLFVFLCLCDGVVAVTVRLCCRWSGTMTSEGIYFLDCR